LGVSVSIEEPLKLIVDGTDLIVKFLL
jgi:hypothetical protein